jgi:tetratricopeptide (TPR) repeat protein
VRGADTSGAGRCADPAGRAHALELLAAAAELLQAGEAVPAERMARRAVNALDAAHCGLAAARARRLRADALGALERYAEALEAYDQAREAFAAEDAPAADIAGCDGGTAACQRGLGDHGQARDLLAIAAAGYREAGLRGRAAICDLDRAVLVHAGGDAEGAVSLLADARRTLVALRRLDALAACDFNLGVALADAGRPDAAIAAWQEAQSRFDRLGDESRAAGCHQNLGVALLAQEQLVEARTELWEARRTFARLGEVEPAAECDDNLGAVLRALGDEDRADRFEALAAKVIGEDTEPDPDPNARRVVTGDGSSTGASPDPPGD